MNAIVAAAKRFLNSLTVKEAESAEEFIKLIEYVDNPEIWISAHVIFTHVNRSDSQCYWLCGFDFVSRTSDGTTAILRRREEVRVWATNFDGAKHYVNMCLMKNHIEPPVRLISSLIPTAKISVIDIYGKVLSLVEFMGKYSGT